MTPVTSAKIKYGIWGLLFGAVIAMIVGFAWGGWSTQRTAQAMTAEAVLAGQSAICVAQFMKHPNNAEAMKAFEAYSSWKKAEFIEKGGWDKMPGQDKADAAVARACADGIAAFLKQ